MSTYKLRAQRLAASVLLALTLVGCNDENRAHDDNTRPEHNSSRLPGNEAPNEYNVQPALPLKTATNEALRYPVAPQDTARQQRSSTQRQTNAQQAGTNTQNPSANTNAQREDASVR